MGQIIHQKRIIKVLNNQCTQAQSSENRGLRPWAFSHKSDPKDIQSYTACRMTGREGDRQTGRIRQGLQKGLDITSGPPVERTGDITLQLDWQSNWGLLYIAINYLWPILIIIIILQVNSLGKFKSNGIVQLFICLAQSVSRHWPPSWLMHMPLM